MNLKSLFAKLNDTCRNATESAAALCLAERHYEVDIEHVLLQLLEGDDNDLLPILRHYDVVIERLQSQLASAMSDFKTGNTRTPALSPHITQLIERAWVLASIEYGQSLIRSGFLLQALLDDKELRRVIAASAPELEKINVDDLKANLEDFISASSESQQSASLPAGNDTQRPATKGNGKTPALDQYTVDLTLSAREGRIDPVLGREFEVRQMVDILTRRRQNNPILTGEAGVGKTAVVEGLALRIALGDVPTPLKDVAIHTEPPRVSR
ncbi:Clp protease N-terminal domain-containing protein, partial [Pseudomonas amygdali]|uniref:Clp protease N-terminal domain-containing protein n=1 Tax=Pseudomonas amygdali TaxID=47877 RepID=UPI0001CC218A